jgi:Zn-finger protein
MKAKEVEKRIEEIMELFSFEKISKEHPEMCPCYKKGKKCHEIAELNCFFCFCPEYDRSKQEGGCKRSSKYGKWFFHKKLPKGKIWDCSLCTYPHEKKNAIEILRKIYK